MARLIAMAALLSLTLIGGGTAAQGAWIKAKALVAQRLIERAWTRSQSDSAQPDSAADLQPWPWADTHVVARLRVPSQSITQFVLAGAHGQALAFGPGHLSATPLPGESGNAVVAGHRDTHFGFLRHLRGGEAILVDLPDGRTSRYVVRRLWVTTDTDVRPLEQHARTTLTLITCYPFDALQPGGPLRYVVEADLEHDFAHTNLSTDADVER